MQIDFEHEENNRARIKVIGVGGCGGNLVHYMRDRDISNIQYLAVNTDMQALKLIPQDISCMQIGHEKTRGLGAGAKPSVGAEAATAEASRLRDMMKGLDMVFIAAGMGKGTGTGASPVIAKIAQEEGVLTVAVVTLPFDFERRSQRAEQGVIELSKYTDSVILVPNNKLLDVMGGDTTVKDAYAAANNILYNAVRGVSDIINEPGMMNVDFNDVRTAMSGRGKAVFGSSSHSGEDRAEAAAREALHSPLMEDVDLTNASNVLVNITCAETSLRMNEMTAVTNIIEENVRDFSGEIFQGIVWDNTMDNELRVTIIVTGVTDDYEAVAKPTIMQSAPPEAEKKPSTLIQDPSLVPGRKRREYNAMLEQHGGDEKKIPTVLRRQVS